MKTLSQKQILALHSALIKEFGGSDGVRDEGLLESALAAPFQTFGGEPVYPSLQAKAAQLGFGLVCNHPFVDGNKRIGAHAPPFCGRQQADRRSCHAGFSGCKWDRALL